MLIQKIVQQFNAIFSPQPIPASCPNCWGFSQWENKDCYRHFDLDKGQNSEIQSRNGFIRKFVKTFVG